MSLDEKVVIRAMIEVIILLLLYNIRALNCGCINGLILGAASDGTTCEVFGNSVTDGYFRNQCLSINDTLPITKSPAFPAGQELSTFLKLHELSLVDFLISDSGLLTGVGLDNDTGLKCFHYNTSIRIVECGDPVSGTLQPMVREISGFSYPLLTGIEFTPDYDVFSWNNLNGKTGLQFYRRKFPSVNAVEIDEYNITAMMYVGSNETGAPFLGIFTRDKSMNVYEAKLSHYPKLSGTTLGPGEWTFPPNVIEMVKIATYPNSVMSGCPYDPNPSPPKSGRTKSTGIPSWMIILIVCFIVAIILVIIAGLIAWDRVKKQPKSFVYIQKDKNFNDESTFHSTPTTTSINQMETKNTINTK